jgi:hypothetical protein
MCGSCRGPPTKQPEIIDLEELEHLQMMREFTNSDVSVPAARVIMEDGSVAPRADIKQAHDALINDTNVVAEVAKFALRGDEGTDGTPFIPETIKGTERNRYLDVDVYGQSVLDEEILF